MTRDIIENWLSELHVDLVANYNRLGLRASGQWERDLETKVTDTATGYKAEILGSSYTGVLETGRSPNRNKAGIRAWVGWAGSTFLKDWVERKGVQISPFAVAWKIAREGITVPNPHNQGGLVSDVLTEARIDELARRVILYEVNNLQSDVIKILKANASK